MPPPPAPAPILVLGLGNDLVSDDGFGPAVAAACAADLASTADLEILSASVAGFHLLDLLQGRRRVLILDVVATGQRPPGSLTRWPLERASQGWTLGGSHQMDLPGLLDLGRRIGMGLPESIDLLAAEAADLTTVREELTPALQAAVPRAAACVRAWVQTGVLPD